MRLLILSFNLYSKQCNLFYVLRFCLWVLFVVLFLIGSLLFKGQGVVFKLHVILIAFKKTLKVNQISDCLGNIFGVVYEEKGYNIVLQMQVI